MQRSALCRSRRDLSNAYFLAKFGLDTAENKPYQVYPTEQSSLARKPDLRVGVDGEVRWLREDAADLGGRRSALGGGLQDARNLCNFW